MKRSIIPIFFISCIFTSFYDACANEPQRKPEFLSRDLVQELNQELNYSLVYLSTKCRQSIVALDNLLPDDFEWSDDFKNLCKDIHDQGTVVPYDIAHKVIDECLQACHRCPHQRVCSTQSDLEEYLAKLQSGKMHIKNFENE